MVSSAVLGAAAGTGLALVIAVTIVVYKYYSMGRKVKSWSSLDRWPGDAKCSAPVQQTRGEKYCQPKPKANGDRLTHESEVRRVLDSCRGTATSYCALQKTEFSVSKDLQHGALPTSASTLSTDSTTGQLQHQCSRSSSGSRMSLATRAMTSLSRRPSQGSQEQLPINEQQQQQQQPQIRTFDPDGRHHNHELLHAASSYPPSRGSRSPSPVRAASLDARCSSPLGQQASLLSAAQLAASQPGLASASSSQAASQAPRSPAARCLSPLMIPSPRASFSLSTDGGLPPASPLGALQPDLYQRRDQPLFLSRGSGKSLGRLRLRLSYDFDKSDLDVHLVEASELAGGEHGGFQDPYVKLSLSPEVDARKRQTGVHHNEANPRFDQHFKFPVSQDELQDKTLLLQVLDDDRFSRNDVVGSLRVALDGLDISSRGGVELWGEVSRERKPPEEKQEVCLSLSYLPQAGRLAMTLHKARNLFPLPGKQSLDAFVKVGLISGEKRVKKKKTSVRKATRCPDWNEAFTFSVAQSALATSAIEICVLDSSSQESSSGHAVIGSCIVGPGLGQAGLDSGTSNPSVEHWQLMIQSPRENITMWHTLH
ncbi:synaptotagmin-C [Trichogramma pretiosum]|uniref:synaptotagmin-C n=1 Tax=Trichogramma pretiosum TaxID=7493 RepID=UPI000C71AF9F|nr:synaptotagmin-C [Trichogramma pretiosum]